MDAYMYVCMDVCMYLCIDRNYMTWKPITLSSFSYIRLNKLLFIVVLV